MNFPFYIAKRYFIAKKSHNVINIITWIAITGVSIVTAALIVVLSAVNGIEHLVLDLFNSFDPQIKITVKEGKTFDPTTAQFDELRKLENVAFYTEILEENALLKHQDKQYIATIKGVSENFREMSRLDTMLVDGNFELIRNGAYFSVIGQGVAYNLGINLLNYIDPIQIYVPQRTKKTALNPEEAFKNMPVYASGVFSIQHDFDSKYIIVPIELTRELLNYSKEVTSIELAFTSEANLSDIQDKIKLILGEDYDVKDRFEQHDFLYKIMKFEKLAAFLILSFILLIATFNVIGSLTMLIIDKKKDLKILWNMGASTITIRKIFFIEGMIISVTGAIIGIVLGLILCLIQIHFEVVKFGGSFVMEAYPVKLDLLHFVYVFLTVITIGAFAAWYPARQITKKHLPSNE